MIKKSTLISPKLLHTLSSQLPSSSPPSFSPSTCKTINTLLQLHAHLITSGTTLTNFTRTHLINSYFSFNKPHPARSLFDSTPTPNAPLCNAIIRAYIKANHHNEALNIYYTYMIAGNVVEPDKFTFTFVIKACTGLLDYEEGVKVHREVVGRGLESDVFIGAGLVDMYCKMGDLGSARHLFDKMPVRDVVAWNAMIAGFSQSDDEFREALECCKRMQVDGGLEANSVSLLNLFPGVCKLGDIKVCRSIHGYMCRRDFQVSVLNGLIDVYCKCGRADVGRRVFDSMGVRDDVSWGTMMAGYVHNGRFCEVIELFDRMKIEIIMMNKVSAASALLAAAETRDLEKGIDIHDSIIFQRIDSDVRVATPLLTMYAKCGELVKAKKLLEELPERDLVAWSALIGATAQSGYFHKALSLFRDMQNDNLKPNKITLVSVLPVCAELLSVKLGKSIHCFAVKANMGSDVSIGTGLVSMYAKCGLFTSAHIVFNNMLLKDVVTWNALITGYAQIGDPYSAMDIFCQLQSSGLHPDAGTFVGVLPACANLNNLGHGSCVHGSIVKLGFESDCHVKNALIDMYSKCGSLSSAEFIFHKTEFTKDEVSWNVMITGYVQNGHAKEAIYTFYQMKFENFTPTLVTIVSILPAISSLAALKEGMAVHAHIVHLGFQYNTLVSNSLIDMYAKCGRLDHSEEIFNEMDNKDTVSWNAMLAGYAIHGHGVRATEFFSLMQASNVDIDYVSFISVLSACRHAGLVEEGKKIFYSMHEKHNLEPDLEHYACMVDLLGHAGLFDETMSLIESMPMAADAGVWGALLDACKMHGNVKLAEVALNYLVKLEPGNPAHYVVLSTVYAESGRWGDARSTRLQMNDRGLRKTPGYSWLEVKNRVQDISSG